MIFPFESVTTARSVDIWTKNYRKIISLLDIDTWILATFAVFTPLMSKTWESYMTNCIVS